VTSFDLGDRVPEPVPVGHAARRAVAGQCRRPPRYVGWPADAGAAKCDATLVVQTSEEVAFANDLVDRLDAKT
jgi:hypothetical protein